MRKNLSNKKYGFIVTTLFLVACADPISKIKETNEDQKKIQQQDQENMK